MKTSGGGLTNVNYASKHINIGGHYDHIGRDFRVNDIGIYRSRTNRNQVNGSLEVGNPDPWKKLRSVWGFLYANNEWRNDKLLTGRYTAETFAISRGRVIASAVAEVEVRKLGFERFVAREAEESSLVYGIFAVGLSLLMGWLAGRVFALV